MYNKYFQRKNIHSTFKYLKLLMDILLGLNLTKLLTKRLENRFLGRSGSRCGFLGIYVLYLEHWNSYDVDPRLRGSKVNMSDTTGDQPKLMDYYVQNPDEFKKKFYSKDNLHRDYELICTDDTSQYFKFVTPFNPKRVVPKSPKSNKDFSYDNDSGCFFPSEKPAFKQGEKIKYLHSKFKLSSFQLFTDLDKKCLFAVYLAFEKKFLFSPCPWQHKMKIQFEFFQWHHDGDKMALVSSFSFCSDENPIKEITAKIDLSIENDKDIPKENKWNDEFSFTFKRGSYPIGQTNLFDTGRASDIKKLLLSDSKILGMLTLQIKFSNEYLFKKRVLEEIERNTEFGNLTQNGVPIALSSNDSKKKEKKLDKLHESILLKISPVFKAMEKNPEIMEAKENALLLTLLEEKYNDVLYNFHALLRYEGIFPRISPCKSNPNPLLDLLIFADKYDIKSLYKTCSEHISDHLGDENVLKVLKVSDKLNDVKLFDKAMKNFLATKEDEVREYCFRHPEMVAEMMEFAKVPFLLDMISSHLNLQVTYEELKA